MFRFAFYFSESPRNNEKNKDSETGRERKKREKTGKT
jgi:hypothetical protein